MIRVGLVGLPNAGKSTLFNFLTGANALVASYPFSTVTPNKATLKLYDADADALAKAVDAPDIQRTEVEVWDIAGLIKNASQGEGLGNEFLGQIKDCDVVVHVVRVTQTSTPAEIKAAIDTVITEIALFDHKCLLKPFEQGRRMARLYPNIPAHVTQSDILSKAYYGTKEGALISDILDEKERALIPEVDLISTKPFITLLNTDAAMPVTDTILDMGGDMAASVSELMALVELSEEERAFLEYSDEPIYNFLYEYCELLLKKAKLKHFYTIGHLGVGQWVVPQTADAAACAHLVHADLGHTVKTVKVGQKADFLRLKSWANLTKHGLVKKYGDSYIPRDKDILYFEVA